MPAPMAFTLAVLIVLTAGVIVTRNGMHRGRPRLAAATLIGSYALAAVSLGVAIAGWK